MIKICYYDDWIEIWRNGSCIYGNHSITIEDLLVLLDIDYESEVFEDEEV